MMLPRKQIRNPSIRQHALPPPRSTSRAADQKCLSLHQHPNLRSLPSTPLYEDAATGNSQVNVGGTHLNLSPADEGETEKPEKVCFLSPSKGFSSLACHGEPASHPGNSPPSLVKPSPRACQGHQALEADDLLKVYGGKDAFSLPGLLGAEVFCSGTLLGTS